VLLLWSCTKSRISSSFIDHAARKDAASATSIKQAGSRLRAQVSSVHKASISQQSGRLQRCATLIMLTDTTTITLACNTPYISFADAAGYSSLQPQHHGAKE